MITPQKLLEPVIGVGKHKELVEYLRKRYWGEIV